MTRYEENLEVLEQFHPELYEGLQETVENSEQVLIGDALDGEKFLVVLRGEVITALNSTYHPTHEAMRYTAQFAKEPEDAILLLFGFGNGGIIEQVLGEDCPIARCMVYEPSLDIFRTALKEYDLRHILGDRRLTIFVDGINGHRLEHVLDDKINYRSWRHFKFRSLSAYADLYPEQYREVRGIFHRIYQYKSADMNTLINFARRSLVNEVKAFKWMIDCRTLDGMKGHFPVDMPYIVVAAGPSLEKNVEVLRQAKGKAFIVCVDTAIPYLLQRDIIPDMICTVDPGKGKRHFMLPGVNQIPIAVSTDSSHAPLEMLSEIQPIYLSISNDFCGELFKKKGYHVGYFDGGGSVATVCFQMGVELKFRTIILIGQDLAITKEKAHAGQNEIKNSDLKYKFMMVDGYDGGKVMTRADYKFYIDWYNMRIPELGDTVVVNATEGGAKIKGAVQMTLQEAVNRYCRVEYDVPAMFAEVPRVWDSIEEKQEYYEDIKKKYSYFVGFRRRLKDGITQTERAIRLLKRGNYQTKELKKIDRQLDAITKEVETQNGMVILVKRMIETDITLGDDLNDSNENIELESIRLYEKMQKYLKDLCEAAEEMLPIWKDTIQEINEKYHFES